MKLNVGLLFVGGYIGSFCNFWVTIVNPWAGLATSLLIGVLALYMVVKATIDHSS